MKPHIFVTHFLASAGVPGSPSKLFHEKNLLSLGTIFNPLCQKNKWTGDGRYHKNVIFCQGNMGCQVV